MEEMDVLKGKTILIGKEPGNGRLLVAVSGGKAAIIPVNVPNSVSRCKVSEGVAHAKITVDQNGDMTLTNLKPANVTFVNGSEIVSKHIVPSNVVELGNDRFNINLPVVLETAKNIAIVSSANGSQSAKQGSPISNSDQGAAPQICNIKHLEAIYNDYHAKVLARQKKQKKLGLWASCSMFFSIGGSALAALANKLGMGETAQDVLWVLPVIGFIVFFISMYLRIKDTSIEDADALNTEYTKSFVCPNCGKFLGNMSYELLKTQIVSPKDHKMHCPHGCGAEFIEK